MYITKYGSWIVYKLAIRFFIIIFWIYGVIAKPWTTFLQRKTPQNIKPEKLNVLISLYKTSFLKEIIIVYSGHNHQALLSNLLNIYVVFLFCFNLSRKLRFFPALISDQFENFPAIVHNQPWTRSSFCSYFWCVPSLLLLGIRFNCHRKNQN